MGGGDCVYSYEISGTSEADGKLFDSSGEEVELIEIDADAQRCPTVTIEALHIERAELLEPRHVSPSCLTNVDGAKTSEISFEHRVSCACDDSWEWFVTDPAPPLKFKVEVRPVAACAD